MNYTAIDLGLPSGTKWCDRNIGASSPEYSGLYFAWGETDGYTKNDIKFDNCPKEFNWSKYKFGRYDKLSKYNKEDKKKVLDPENDAARINMGGDWRMPTREQFKELLEYTTNEWVKDYNGTGVSGRLFTSKINGNSIFVPAAGFAYVGSVFNVGCGGNLWSSSLDEVNVDYAWYLYFDSDYAGVYNNNRFYGFPVRGIVNINNKKIKTMQSKRINNVRIYTYCYLKCIESTSIETHSFVKLFCNNFDNTDNNGILIGKWKQQNNKLMFIPITPSHWELVADLFCLSSYENLPKNTNEIIECNVSMETIYNRNN